MRMDPPRGPDAATLIVRAIRAQAALAGVSVAVRSIASRPWASATFIGLRHHVVLEAPLSAAFAAWIVALPDAEWTIRGHLVADCVVESTLADDGETRVALSILTLAEDASA